MTMQGSRATKLPRCRLAPRILLLFMRRACRGAMLAGPAFASLPSIPVRGGSVDAGGPIVGSPVTTRASSLRETDLSEVNSVSGTIPARRAWLGSALQPQLMRRCHASRQLAAPARTNPQVAVAPSMAPQRGAAVRYSTGPVREPAS